MQAAIPLFQTLSVASSIGQGLAARAAAKGEQQRAIANAHIGRTRAIQTDTVSRQNLNSELAEVRNALAGSGQRPVVGTLEALREVRKVRDRERRIEVGNRNSEAADFRTQARNANSKARGALLGGFVDAMPSIFELIDR